jgi:uncharacterized NAD(P)/FAD-binding protein YdhS
MKSERNMVTSPDFPVIAIVGGGFSGAAFAVHFAMLNHGKARLVVFEPRERLGSGLAYSTLDPAHRVNVPAGKMSLYPDDPEHFLRCLASSPRAAGDPELMGSDGQPYPRRSVFGNYVAAQIAPLLQRGIVEHQRSEVASIQGSGKGWRVIDRRGNELHADVVVLAASHPSPALLTPLQPLRHHPKLVADVTVPAALETIAPHDRVLLLGNGLTAADVVAALEKRGHRGKILSVSRRGLRSRGHPRNPQEPFGDFSSRPATRASVLLRAIRHAIADAGRAGLTWHAVLDAVRAQAFSIWQALPLSERRRIVRHVRPFWDAHRFRIAPQVEEALDRAIAADRLTIRAAGLKQVEAQGEGFKVKLSSRRTRRVEDHIVDAIVVTTGPAHGRILQSQQFLAGLAQDGHVRACETGLGIACDLDARALGADGVAIRSLFVLGPLARGTFGELMGLPQVTEHAVFVAGKVAETLEEAPASPLRTQLQHTIEPHFRRRAV